jgi:hypothetical protein
MNKFRCQVFFVELVFLGNFLISWVLTSTFATLYAYEAGTVPKGQYSDQFFSKICKYSNAGGMYLMAGFLLAALSQIRQQLKGTDFNSNAMVIHIVAVFLNFITGFIGFVADFVFHEEKFSRIAFLIGGVFTSTV